MFKKTLIAVLIMPLFVFAACDKKPVNRLANPTTSNTTGSTVWTAPWIVYDDEIKTGGGIARFTTPEGQVLDFASTENPHSGLDCVKFSWDGSEVRPYADPNTAEHSWVGFSFKVLNDNIVNSPSTKDLSPGHYTKLSFYARGTLSANVTLRVKGAGATSETIIPVTSAWQHFTAPTGTLTDVDTFAIFVLGSNGSSKTNGGIVFLDDIQLIQ